MAEATATATPPDARRKKQVLLQKQKARNAAASSGERSTTPEQQKTNGNSTSPALSRRRSTASVSLRRRQIIEKRRHKITSPNSTPVKDDPPVESLNDEEKKEHSPRHSSERADGDSHGDSADDPPVPTKEASEENSTAIVNDVEENTAISPKEDRNDKVVMEKKSSSWDTRSIHEYPPEPAVDPTWDASKPLFDDKKSQNEKEEPDAPKDWDSAKTDFDEKESEFKMFDSGSWPPKETASLAATTPDNDTKRDSGLNEDNGVAINTARPRSSGEHRKAPRPEGPRPEAPRPEGSHVAGPVVSDGSSDTHTSTLIAEANAVMKQVDCSLDVHVGVQDNVRLCDQVLLKTSNDEVDFSATDLDNPINALKDDEALLGSDQVRSDVVADGAESDALDAIRLLNQVEQQKRIEQYKERDDDTSSVGNEEEEDPKEEGSDEEDFEDDEEIDYISADSEEEEELSRHVDSFTVPDVRVGDTTDQGATFDAAASAALGAVASKDGSTVQMENLDVVNTNSSGSGSEKGGSTAVESSVASSSLFGAGVLSLGGTSVNTEVTATSTGSKGPGVDSAAAAAPPPPPSSQPPKKKKAQKGSKKPKPLLKIPPPPPEKLKKWEEDKMRPLKHIQAVADAKAKSLGGTSEQDSTFEEAPSSEYVSLSLITSVSSTHSQDEIETTLADISSAERNEKATHSVGLDDSQVTHKTQDVSFRTASSAALMSPPHVPRTKLNEAAGLAPDEDGVWKEESTKKTPKKKNTSPIADNKMAERLAVASYTAARKFEEKYGDVDEKVMLTANSLAESQNVKDPSAEAASREEKPDTSYFCDPDMLGGTSFCQPPDDSLDDGNLLSQISSQAKGWASMDGSDKAAAYDTQRNSMLDSSFDDTHHAGMELVGGAFSTWKNSDYAYGSDAGAKDPEMTTDSLEKVINAATEDVCSEDLRLLSWLESDVLCTATKVGPKPDRKNDMPAQAALERSKLLALLEDDANFNSLCGYASANVIVAKPSEDRDPNDEQPAGMQSKTSVHPFKIPADVSRRPSSSVLAANFISFLNRISVLSGIESPFKDENPFLMDVVTTSLQASATDSAKKGEAVEEKTVQELIFQHELGEVVTMVRFFYQVCGTPAITDTTAVKKKTPDESKIAADSDVSTEPRIEEIMNLLYKVPTQSPCPFETAVWNLPSIVAIVLGFLGDPVAVCRMKMINHFCKRLIQENEHIMMRDAVRLGGIGMHIRPAFWMWIALEKCGRRTTNSVDAPSEGEQPSQEPGQDCESGDGQPKCITTVLPELEKRGREGKWHHVIQRDVSRAFGNMPPHKTGARLRTDSIVRALVTWGRGRVLSRGVKGGGVSSPTPVIPPPGNEKVKSKPRPSTGPPPWERGDSGPHNEENSQGPPDTVSQWSGISPVPSFCSNSGLSDKGESGSVASRANLANGVARALERAPSGKQTMNSRAIEELALSGNALTAEMKEGLQNQLGYILHALAAAHDDVGYCQGMDYVVAHLLRVLQDTVRWHSVRGTLSPVIKAQPEIPEADSDERSLTKEIDQAIDSSLVVEETVFRVMDTFLTTYNLRHMYWPELRCLKTCCRVFERLIQMKLPVLADHFAYHELNVGLFALGWFQTLFLYLPSMPSATVCHMWDIWLVERSFKIFFRVGTAILFLSQPILLNHELEGMMTYLNTFPDATLLNPDILIACALQIKVTNRMLEDIERDLTGGR